MSSAGLSSKPFTGFGSARPIEEVGQAVTTLSSTQTVIHEPKAKKKGGNAKHTQKETIGPQLLARTVSGGNDVDSTNTRRTQIGEHMMSLERVQGEMAKLKEAYLNERDRRLEEESRGRNYKASAESYKQQLDIANQQFEEARSETDALKGFLSTYDDASVEDVAGFLKDINDRIEEIACENANHLLFEIPPKKSRGTVPITEDVYRELERILGAAFVTTLWGTSADHECALFLLQSAWQACVVDGVRIILEAFSPTSIANKFDSLLLQLGQSIREGESQPIYGRWRALTHQYLRLGASAEENAIVKFRAQKTVRGCYEIALLLFKTAGLDGSEFFATFEAELEEVFARGLKLAAIIRERVSSTDYRPFAPTIASPGGFDELMMVATETNTIPPAGSEVLCTIRLGMTSTSKQGQGRTGTDVELVF